MSRKDEMNANKWRIEGVEMHPGQWGYALFEPGYVQVPIATSDSWDHLWTLIRLCGFLDVYARTDSHAFRVTGPIGSDAV